MAKLAGLLLCATLLVPAGDDKDTPKDLDKLQGAWKVAAVNSRGKEIPAEMLDRPNFLLVVVGDQYVFMTHGGKLILDPAKNQADLEVKAGRYKGTTLPCRYELKDDTLKLTLPASLLNPVLPAETKPGEAPIGIVYTLKREAKVAKEQAEAQLKDRTAALPDNAGPGFGPRNAANGFPGAKGGPANTTQQLLQRILERLDRIEERLDALEKKLNVPRESK
jgi:uncharacterized protein (TIGR03067 family)